MATTSTTGLVLRRRRSPARAAVRLVAGLVALLALWSALPYLAAGIGALVSAAWPFALVVVIAVIWISDLAATARAGKE